MKTILVIVILFVSGCLPATQQEVQTLTETVKMIMPAVREAVSASSEDTKEKIEVVLGQVEEINEAVATADDPIEAIEKGWAASEPFNPYYLYGTGVLALIRLWQKKKESDNSLEEVVIGVEDSKKNGGNLKLAFNATESLVTRRKVAKILSKA